MPFQPSATCVRAWYSMKALLTLLACMVSHPWSAHGSEDFGRLHSLHPVSHCCLGDSCLAGETAERRHAVVTTMRSPEYMMGLRELACALGRTNPGVHLVILGDAGDFDPDSPIVEEIKQLGEYRLEEDLRFPNTVEERFSLNWIKLRAWQWEEYDALIILDADVLVRGHLTHVFHLPTHFAWTRNNGADGWDFNKGGVIMMRPCKKTYEAMMAILAESPRYHFVNSYAEQDFLSWYFRYTAMELPTRYNINSLTLDGQGLGPGGTPPVLIHFAHPPEKQRLLNATQSDPLWSYLCYQPQHPELQAEREQQAQLEHAGLQTASEQQFPPQHAEPQHVLALRAHSAHVRSALRSLHHPDLHRHAPLADSTQD